MERKDVVHRTFWEQLDNANSTAEHYLFFFHKNGRISSENITNRNNHNNDTACQVKQTRVNINMLLLDGLFPFLPTLFILDRNVSSKLSDVCSFSHLISVVMLFLCDSAPSAMS